MIDTLAGANPMDLSSSSFASTLEAMIAQKGYDSPKAQAIRGMVKDLEEYRKDKVLLPRKR